MEDWAQEHGEEFSSRLDMIKDQGVQSLIEEQVQDPLQGVFASYEIPKKVGLLLSPFTIEAGTLTPTQKIKRKVVASQCVDLVAALYAPINKEKTVIVESDEEESVRLYKFLVEQFSQRSHISYVNKF